MSLAITYQQVHVQTELTHLLEHSNARLLLAVFTVLLRGTHTERSKVGPAQSHSKGGARRIS